jgi:hypothetical protein
VQTAPLIIAREKAFYLIGFGYDSHLPALHVLQLHALAVEHGRAAQRGHQRLVHGDLLLGRIAEALQPAHGIAMRHASPRARARAW